MAMRAQAVYPDLAAAAGGQDTSQQTSILANEVSHRLKASGGAIPSQADWMLNPALVIVGLMALALFALIPWE